MIEHNHNQTACTQYLEKRTHRLSSRE